MEPDAVKIEDLKNFSQMLDLIGTQMADAYAAAREALLLGFIAETGCPLTKVKFVETKIHNGFRISVTE